MNRDWPPPEHGFFHVAGASVILVTGDAHMHGNNLLPAVRVRRRRRIRVQPRPRTRRSRSVRACGPLSRCLPPSLAQSACPRAAGPSRGSGAYPAQRRPDFPAGAQQTGRSYFRSAPLRRLLELNFDVIHDRNISRTGADVLGFGKAPQLCTPHGYWLICPAHMLFRFNRGACESRWCRLCALSSGRPPQWWRQTDVPGSALRNIDAFLPPGRSGRDLEVAGGIGGRFNPPAGIRAGVDGSARRHQAQPRPTFRAALFPRSRPF